jgi:hypothetical protein
LLWSWKKKIDVFKQLSLKVFDAKVQLGPHAFMAWG